MTRALTAFFKYDPDTGLLWWRLNSFGTFAKLNKIFIPIIFLLFLLPTSGFSAETSTQCVATKPKQQQEYWAYRIIDNRPCWYRGRPGRPKTELRWALDVTPSPSVAERDRVYPDHDPAPAAAASSTAVAAPEPASWRASDEDTLLAFTCCWPELNSEPAAAEPKPQTPMAPPHEAYRPWWLLPIIVYIAYRLFGLHLMRGETA